MSEVNVVHPQSADKSLSIDRATTRDASVCYAQAQFGEGANLHLTS